MHALESSTQGYTLDLGDHIGMESCVDLRTDVDMEVVCGGGGGGRGVGKKGCRRTRVKREEYPPALARVENVPWVLKRYYTNDGRLVIREEKAEHHQRFRAHRANGRLTLHIVEHIDGVLDARDEEMREDNDGDGQCGGGEDNGVVSEVITVDRTAAMGGGGGGVGGGGKWYNYNSMRANTSCMLGMPVPAIRPVHI